MPELPDVESARRFFAHHALGRRVSRVVVTDAGILRNAMPRALDDALAGRTFEEPERLGKWLLCWTDGPALLLHFGMTGELTSSADTPARHRWDRVILELDGGGEIRYRNVRKLGGVWLVHDRTEAAAILRGLGPDALSIRRGEFLARLSRRRGGVKAALMDQALLAGVGNLLADEILWQARLHPRRRIEKLNDDERSTLFGALHAVVRGSLNRPAGVPWKRSWLNRVRGEPEAVCPRCRTPLERATVAGRTTWFCPRCQPSDEATPFEPGRRGRA